MTARQVLFGAGLVGLGAGAILYFKRQADLLMEMSYRVRNFRFVEKTATRVVITLDFQIINKSEVPLLITGYDLSFFSNDIYLARVEDPKAKIEIPPFGATNNIPIRLEFDPRTLGRSVLSNVLDLLSGEGITLLIRGNLNVRVGLLGFDKVDVNYSFKPLSSND